MVEKEKELSSPIKLDYTLKTAEERNNLVKKIIEQAPPASINNKYLEILSDYILLADKEERKKRDIITDNMMITIRKRETSLQGLAENFENGEDGIYNLISDNNKNIIFTPKIEISKKDLEEIPFLKELRESIEQVEEQEKRASGKRKFLLKKQLIEMRKDQYVIKSAYKQPIPFINATKCFSKAAFDEKIIVEGSEVKDNGLINLFNPKHVSALLCNYSKLKEDSWGKFWTDSYYLMEDLDSLIEDTLKEGYPLYYDLLIYKIDGKTNKNIKDLLYEKYGKTHTEEYISSLWRNKIPKLLAEKAKEQYLMWYYTMKEKGKWKRCSRCGQIKLADNKFFSRNKSSKDGFYSICKACRNNKK